MRTPVDYRTAGTDVYKDFCKKHPNINITIDEWRNIIYTYNEQFKLYILETGEKIKMPFGFGEFSIKKKKRRKMKGPNDEYMNLPIDWKKTKEKGKVIYNFNFHTEGYFFGWVWFKKHVSLKQKKCWFFKPSRTTSRLLAHYINIDPKYKDLYVEWITT